MKFFFPDSQDLVDPSFDFLTEKRSETRIRQQHDEYPHEVFATPPYDGMLVSKGIVDGTGSDGGRYTIAQRQRLLRQGVRSFFRLEGRPIETMGDCGAFSYVKERRPPFSVQEVIDFYANCGFDYGLSVDHIILAFQPGLDETLSGLDVVPEEWRERQRITLELAEEFLRLHRDQRCRFVPVGIAQGWSPRSYAEAFGELQQMGYRYIALGGMVPLKTPEILSCLKAVDKVRRPETQIHLLGVTRIDHIPRFSRLGVVSFDSTSPLRQAFKDEKDNYYTLDRTYCAIRVPQVDGNPKLRRRIASGAVDQAEARRLEQACLGVLNGFDGGRCTADEALAAIQSYEGLHDERSNRAKAYREILSDQPWKRCPCEICRRIGIHVMLFRGAERNRRRGFHNLYVFHQRVQRESEGSPARGRRVGTV
ncbi:tRNA-guanine transglycosylase DpdA [Tautonia plasticadhaerens]|uniref:Queuine tRNA-ribosyltransferase n=1 Tax=Tautonia plasticadhaerens TaxID=2527974 RepID=A0A518H995_9BACT|nr:tRNA-guanine transglycosylase DpdA [Tautonia plasticadhaerens]QDV37420.1 Queuine tRNA-ribosyltransferase [Tautonia plasticadhaerens]